MGSDVGLGNLLGDLLGGEQTRERRRSRIVEQALDRSRDNRNAATGLANQEIASLSASLANDALAVLNTPFNQANSGASKQQDLYGLLAGRVNEDNIEVDKFFQALHARQDAAIDQQYEIAVRNEVEKIDRKIAGLDYSPEAIRFRRRQDEIPDFSDRLARIRQELTPVTRSKTGQSDLPPAFLRPSRSLAFSGDSLGQAGFGSGLGLDITQRVTLNPGQRVSISGLVNAPPTSPPTHYLVRLTGGKNEDADGLNPAPGALHIYDNAGNIARTLDNSAPQLITAAEFENLAYQHDDRDVLDEASNYLSLIAVNKVSAGPDLTAADDVGSFTTITFAKQKEATVEVREGSSEYRVSSLVERGSRFQRVAIDFEGQFFGPDILDDYNNGRVNFRVTEYGRPDFGPGEKVARLNLAESSGNRLVFDFESDNVYDGVAIRAEYQRELGYNLLVSGTTASFT